MRFASPHSKSLLHLTPLDNMRHDYNSDGAAATTMTTTTTTTSTTTPVKRFLPPVNSAPVPFTAFQNASFFFSVFVRLVLFSETKRIDAVEQIISETSSTHFFSRFADFRTAEHFPKRFRVGGVTVLRVTLRSEFSFSVKRRRPRSHDEQS